MCPKYCGVALERIKVGDVEVDRCPKCEGIWFDSEGDELLEVLRGGWDNAPEPIKRSWEAGGVKFAPLTSHKYNCPRCGRELSTHNYLGVRGAFGIDGCPEGHGVWLDDSELGNAYVVLKQHASAQLEKKPPKSSIMNRIIATLAGR